MWTSEAAAREGEEFTYDCIIVSIYDIVSGYQMIICLPFLSS